MSGARVVWIALWLLTVPCGGDCAAPTPSEPPVAPSSSEDTTVQVVAGVIVGVLFIIGMLLYYYYARGDGNRARQAEMNDDIEVPMTSPRVLLEYAYDIEARVVASGKKGTIIAVDPDSLSYDVLMDTGEVLHSYPEEALEPAAPTFKVGDVVQYDNQVYTVTAVRDCRYSLSNGTSIETDVPERNIRRIMKYRVGDKVFSQHPGTGKSALATVVVADPLSGNYNIRFSNDHLVAQGVPEPKLEKASLLFKVGDVVTAHNPTTGRIETAVVDIVNRDLYTYSVRFHSSGVVNTVPQHALTPHDGFHVGDRVTENLKRIGTVIGYEPGSDSYLIEFDTPDEDALVPASSLRKVDSSVNSILITCTPEPLAVGDVVASHSIRKAGYVTSVDPFKVRWYGGGGHEVTEDDVELYTGYLPGQKVKMGDRRGTVVKIKDRRGWYKVRWKDGRNQDVVWDRLEVDGTPRYSVGDVVMAFNAAVGDVETGVVQSVGEGANPSYEVKFHARGTVGTVPEHMLSAYDGYLIGDRVLVSHKGNGPRRPGTIVGLLSPQGTYLVKFDDATNRRPKETPEQWIVPMSPGTDLARSTPLLGSSASQKFSAIEALINADSTASRAPRYMRSSSRNTVLLETSI